MKKPPDISDDWMIKWMNRVAIIVFITSLLGCTTQHPFAIHEITAGIGYTLGNSTANTALFGQGTNPVTGKVVSKSSSWSHTNGDSEAVFFYLQGTIYTDANPLHELVNLMRLQQLRQEKPKGHTHE